MKKLIASLALVLFGCSASADTKLADDLHKALPYEKVACAFVAESLDPAVIGPLCAFIADEEPQLEALLRAKAAALAAKKADAGSQASAPDASDAGAE